MLYYKLTAEIQIILAVPYAHIYICCVRIWILWFSSIFVDNMYAYSRLIFTQGAKLLYWGDLFIQLNNYFKNYFKNYNKFWLS